VHGSYVDIRAHAPREIEVTITPRP